VSPLSLRTALSAVIEALENLKIPYYLSELLDNALVEAGIA
jgi:hypothetical protein